MMYFFRQMMEFSKSATSKKPKVKEGEKVIIITVILHESESYSWVFRNWLKVELTRDVSEKGR